MSVTIDTPFIFFTDADGKPLENGSIYIGTASLNPEQSPIQVYWDAAQTIPAAQPIRTVSGYPSRAGTASRLYVGTLYSITVRDKNGVLLFNNPISDAAAVSQGSTSGSGVKNYISNPDFESGTATGWNLGKDFGTTQPTSGGIGGGATEFISLTIDNATPLSGNGSLSLNKSTAPSQGSTLYSNNITINREDIGTVMQLSFSYQTPAGKYSDGDLSVFVWDVTGGNLIPCSVSAIPSSGGSPAKHLATFVTSINTVYRIIYMWTGAANANNLSLDIDSIVMTPYQATSGAAVGNWTSYTPVVGTGITGYTSSGLQWRRIGSSLHVSGVFVASGVDGTTAALLLPSGLTLTEPDATTRACGKWWRMAAAAGSTRKTGALLCASPSPDRVNFGSDDYTTASAPATTLAANSIFSGGESIMVDFSVPIAQWTSNINLATDFTEYASNSKSDNTASDTTSFAYGAGGSLVPNGAVGTTYIRNIRFIRPIQVTDTLILEVYSYGKWENAKEEFPFYYIGSTLFGMHVTAVVGSPTDAQVLFSQGGATARGSTSYGGIGTDSWAAGYAAGRLWRVRKVSNGNMAEQLQACGPWNAGVTYRLGDFCTYSGNRYVSIISGNLNQTPAALTTYWARLWDANSDGNGGQPPAPKPIAGGLGSGPGAYWQDTSGYIGGDNSTCVGTFAVILFDAGGNMIEVVAAAPARRAFTYYSGSITRAITWRVL